MKIMVERQFDEIGDEYMQSEDVLIDIWIDEVGDMMLERDGELLIIPSEILNGVLSYKKPTP